MSRLLLLNAHGLDVLTFLWALSIYGIAGESNPVMRAVYTAGGVGALLAVRVGVVTIFAWHAPRWRTLLTFGTWLGMVGALSNLVAVGLSR